MSDISPDMLEKMTVACRTLGVVLGGAEFTLTVFYRSEEDDHLHVTSASSCSDREAMITAVRYFLDAMESGRGTFHPIPGGKLVGH